MDVKNIFIKQLVKERRGEFFNHLLKAIFISLFAIAILYLIYDQWQSNEIVLVVVLFIVELSFILIAFTQFKYAMEYYSIENSRIFQCINVPERVTEIVITPNKIVFELKGMEDETIFIKNSPKREKMISIIEQHWGTEKIVKNY